MVFGIHKRAREKKEKEEREKAEATEARNEIKAIGMPEQIETARDTSQQIADVADERVGQQREKDKVYRSEDRSDIEQSLNRSFSGLTEQEKTAMQETANRQISQQSQRSNRQMQSEAGDRGFVAGDDALKMETARLATDAQGQFSRDLAVMDADVALQKLTTALIMEESRSADRLLMDAGFRDELIAIIDRDKQERWQDYYAQHGIN
jgi:hypothetical protein